MSDDEAQAGVATRYYAPDEADRLVPHVAAAFERIGHHRAMVRAIASELATLGVDLERPLPPHLRDDTIVAGHIGKALSEHRAITGELGTLAELGVEVKALDGLCDVRSWHEGRVVYLCWRVGEARFGHWHELEAGFAGRKPITEPGDFEGTLLN